MFGVMFLKGVSYETNLLLGRGYDCILPNNVGALIDVVVAAAVDGVDGVGAHRAGVSAGLMGSVTVSVCVLAYIYIYIYSLLSFSGFGPGLRLS